MPPLPRSHNPSLEEFRNQYARPGRPVILTGLTEQWPARDWTPESLSARFPGVEVELTPSHSEVEGTHPMLLTDFVATLEDPPPELFYLTSWCFREHCPELLGDFQIPALFSEDWLEELPELNDMLWLFLGPAGAGMGLHQDLGHTAAWNAQVTGRKRWALISPRYDEWVYEGEVDAFEPDLVRYPDFAQVEVWEGTVEAGEILFIPGGWWHQTVNQEIGFAITANYVDITNYQRVLDCLEEYGEAELYAMLMEIVERRVPA